MSPDRVDVLDPPAVSPDGSAWEEIARQWRERRFDRLRSEVANLDDAAVERVDRVVDGELPGEEAEDALRGLFASTAGRPQGAVLAAVYVYARCLELWERSADYPHISHVLRALRSVTGEEVAGAAGPDAPLVDLAVEQAQHMHDAMAVENALQCSCPVAAGEHAGLIVDHVGSLIKRMPAGSAADGAGGLLRADAEVAAIYFGRVRELADAVSSLIDLLEQGEPVGDGHFSAVIDSIRAAERSDAIRDDVYRSELRTHLATAQALERSLEHPWVRIEDAELVYVYPFALQRDGREPDDVIDRAVREGLGWVLGSGVRPTAVSPMRLSDRWEHPDPPRRTYGGVSIHLPPVSVETTAHEPLLRLEGIELELLEFTAEVRLSRLGNHYLRVRSEVREATLHDLNQALRRASPGMGDETVSCAGGEWSRFVSPDDEVPGYVQAIIAGVAEGLGAEVVGDPTSDFHIGVGIRQATIQGGADTGEPPAADDLQTAVGASLLFHSVGDPATSLEEWVRYPSPKVENLMEGSGSVGDLIMRTPDTTVLYMPTSPEWLCSEYEEMIEFVASLPPLLAVWEKELRQRGETLEAALAELRKASADPGERLGQIHRDEAGLHELQAEIRAELADLHSPRLVNNRSTRAFLDRLWDAAGLPAHEAGLERQMAISATLQERLAALASGIAEDNRRRAEERQHRLQRFVEAGLGVITLTSLAGLFDWLNGGFSLSDETIVWLEVGLLVGSIVALVALLAKAWK